MPAARYVQIAGLILIIGIVFAVGRNWRSRGKVMSNSATSYRRDPTGFREMLYANQGLQVMSSMTMATAHPPDPWATFQKAAEHVRAHDPVLAIEELRRIADDPAAETRVRLWAWRGLRDLGHPPDPANADHVLGVVIEMPVEGAADVLALYADGSARYLSHSGKTVVATVNSPQVSNWIRTAISQGQEVLASMPMADETPPPATKSIRVTLLTIGGLHSTESSAQSIRDLSNPMLPLLNSATRIKTAITPPTTNTSPG